MTPKVLITYKPEDDEQAEPKNNPRSVSCSFSFLARAPSLAESTVVAYPKATKTAKIIRRI